MMNSWTWYIHVYPRRNKNAGPCHHKWLLIAVQDFFSTAKDFCRFSTLSGNVFYTSTQTSQTGSSNCLGETAYIQNLGLPTGKLT